MNKCSIPYNIYGCIVAQTFQCCNSKEVQNPSSDQEDAIVDVFSTFAASLEHAV